MKLQHKPNGLCNIYEIIYHFSHTHSRCNLECLFNVIKSQGVKTKKALV